MKISPFFLVVLISRLDSIHNSTPAHCQRGGQSQADCLRENADGLQLTGKILAVLPCSCWSAVHKMLNGPSLSFLTSTAPRLKNIKLLTFMLNINNTIECQKKIMLI